MSRNLPIQSASSDCTQITSQSTSWFDECLLKMSEQLNAKDKNIVEQSRERQAQSVLDQINLMLTSRPSETVESKVQELQERMGLKQFLKQESEKDLQQIPKFAFLVSENELFLKLKPHIRENILQFIRNIIENSRGIITIPAVQANVYDIFKNQGLQLEEINDEKVLRYINQIIAEFQARNVSETSDMSLGKGLGNDESGENTDYFQGMS